MEIIEVNIGDLIPYENNPRNNEDSVDMVVNSIKEFGFKVPIVIDKNNIIVCGHTRYKASKKLGLKKVPCIIADDLSEEQINAFRLVDNKVSEYATWNIDLLNEELEEIEIDMTSLGFLELEEIDWEDVGELSEETYEEPEKKMGECPYCHHCDSKVHFKKIKEEMSAVKLDSYEIRNATLDDIDKIKMIADKNTNQIGFVLKPALEEHCKKGSLLVAESDGKIVGFCNYNKRKKDGVNVIYEVCTDFRYRGNGIGKALLDGLNRPIQLKCPVDNESNNFYEHYGFTLINVEEGKKRKLNVWEIK